MSHVVAIKFKKRAPLCGTTYNAGDIAAFPPHVAEAILKAGAGVRHELPKTEEPKLSLDQKKS